MIKERKDFRRRCSRTILKSSERGRTAEGFCCSLSMVDARRQLRLRALNQRQQKATPQEVTSESECPRPMHFRVGFVSDVIRMRCLPKLSFMSFKVNIGSVEKISGCYSNGHLLPSGRISFG